MFDVGFWELVLILVVVLLVVGPERLPKLARTAGLWLGKARGVVSQVKQDIDREIKAEELKRFLEKQARSSGVHEIIEETRDMAQEARSAVEEQSQYLVEAMPEVPARPADREAQRSQERKVAKGLPDAGPQGDGESLKDAAPAPDTAPMKDTGSQAAPSEGTVPAKDAHERS